MTQMLAIMVLLLAGCATTVPQPEMRVHLPQANPSCVIACKVHVTVQEIKEKDDAP